MPNNIFDKAYHLKVYMHVFHNISSWNPQLLAEIIPEFEKMLEIFLGYLVLYNFCKVRFSLGVTAIGLEPRTT